MELSAMQSISFSGLGRLRIPGFLLNVFPGLCPATTIYDPDVVPMPLAQPRDRLLARCGENLSFPAGSRFSKQLASVPRPDIQPASCLLALSPDFQSVLRASTRTLCGAANCAILFAQSNTTPPVALLAVRGGIKNSALSVSNPHILPV